MPTIVKRHVEETHTERWPRASARSTYHASRWLVGQGMMVHRKPPKRWCYLERRRTARWPPAARLRRGVQVLRRKLDAASHTLDVVHNGNVVYLFQLLKAYDSIPAVEHDTAIRDTAIHGLPTLA